MKKITKTEKKRKKIFALYSNQLHFLCQNNLIPKKVDDLKYEKTYICPICLDQFSEKVLEKNSSNPLTLEDAPQKSLGGKPNTLTCKKCNNNSGKDVDFHLTERLNELDQRKFLPNTSGKCTFELDGKKVQGEFKVDSNGKISILHSQKNNNPKILDEYIEKVKPRKIINLEHKPSRVNNKKLEIALLKTAYILAFEKFGYTFILDESFDDVRKQILNPEAEIYPEGYWTSQSVFRKEHEAVLIIKTPSYVGIYSIFELKTSVTSKIFGVYLPLPGFDYKKTIEKLKNDDGGLGLSFYRPDLNCINEIKDAKKLIKIISEMQ